jgi:hypothetical protein
MFHLSTTAPVVAVDGLTGRPREIRTDGQRIEITGLESIRDETAAYPLESGPRTLFVVRARDRRFRLTHSLWDHRWTVEELGARGRVLVAAA